MPPPLSSERVDTKRQFTFQVRPEFLAAFAESCSIQKAAKWPNIHRQTHYDWLANDPSYPARFKEARERAAQTLEDEAVRRAVHGVHRPVLYKGKQVYLGGEPLFETHHSDRLLIRLLEVYDPERFGRRNGNTEVWDGDLSKLTNKQLEKVSDQLLRQACNNDPEMVEAVKRLVLGSPPETAITVPFEQVNQEPHGLQSSPTQAQSNLVPVSSAGWRRSD
jgi:hypothetical protein